MLAGSTYIVPGRYLGTCIPYQVLYTYLGSLMKLLVGTGTGTSMYRYLGTKYTIKYTYYLLHSPLRRNTVRCGCLFLSM